MDKKEVLTIIDDRLKLAQADKLKAAIPQQPTDLDHIVIGGMFRTGILVDGKPSYTFVKAFDETTITLAGLIDIVIPRQGLHCIEFNQPQPRYIYDDPIQIKDRLYRKGSTAWGSRIWEWRLVDRVDMGWVEVASYSIRDELDRGEIPSHLRDNDKKEQ